HEPNARRSLFGGNPDAILRKPVTTEQLVREVEALIGPKRAVQARATQCEVHEADSSAIEIADEQLVFEEEQTWTEKNSKLKTSPTGEPALRDPRVGAEGGPAAREPEAPPPPRLPKSPESQASTAPVSKHEAKSPAPSPAPSKKQREPG